MYKIKTRKIKNSISKIQGIQNKLRVHGSLYLNTNRQIVVELVPVWTTTFVTANSVDTSIVAAWRRVTFVLVYALVMIYVLDKAIRTPTAVSPHEILTMKIADCNGQ